MFFRHGEQSRLCLEALREAGKPIPADAVARYAMLAKGIPVDDPAIRATVLKAIQIALRRLEKRRGLVRRVVVAPDVWWEMVG